MTAQELADLRLLIADTDAFNEVYTDTELEQFFVLEGSSVRRAAAQALEVHAAAIAQIAGAVRGLLDIRVGGEQSARILLEVAKRYRRLSGIMRAIQLSNFDTEEVAV